MLNCSRHAPGAASGAATRSSQRAGAEALDKDEDKKSLECGCGDEGDSVSHTMSAVTPARVAQLVQHATQCEATNHQESRERKDDAGEVEGDRHRAHVFCEMMERPSRNV